MQEGAKLVISMDQVVYARLFLIGRALKWFKPYLTKIQINGIKTTNQDVRYVFLSWNGFAEQLTQMFRNPKATTTVE